MRPCQCGKLGCFQPKEIKIPAGMRLCKCGKPDCFQIIEPTTYSRSSALASMDNIPPNMRPCKCGDNTCFKPVEPAKNTFSKLLTFANRKRFNEESLSVSEDYSWEASDSERALAERVNRYVYDPISVNRLNFRRKIPTKRPKTFSKLTTFFQ